MEVLDDQPQIRHDGELARELYKFDFSSKLSNLSPLLDLGSGTDSGA